MTNGVSEHEKSHIIEIISTMSYSGGYNPPMETLEGKIVQDADRLDALGAIGIARLLLMPVGRGKPCTIPIYP